MAALAVGTAAAIGLAAITPFDIRPDERSVKEAIKRARLVPFGPAIRGPAPPGDVWSWTAEALAWSLAGGVSALALRESGLGEGRSIAGGAALIAALAAACEMAQVFVGSRLVDATSVVLAAAGGAAGAAVAVLGRRRPPGAWAGPALVIWAIVLVLTQWSPPRFVARSFSDLSPTMLIPFLIYYHQRDLNSLADVVNEVLRTVPLGALLAARRADGRGSAWRAALVGFGAGTLLEVGQLFVVGRHAEITDALWAATGSALGFALWRRGRALVARRGRVG
jgi:VanZ family protein